MSGEPANRDGRNSEFSNMLWRGVCIGHWSSDSLYGKAGGVLQTSALVIAAVTIGMVGVAEAYGIDLVSVTQRDGAAVEILVPVVSLGAAALGALLAAMLFSAMALGIFKARHLFEYNDFVSGDGKGDIDDEVLDRYAGMTKKELYAMYRAHIHRIRDLQKANRAIGGFVVLGQWMLFSGIATIVVLSVFLLARMITHA